MKKSLLITLGVIAVIGIFLYSMFVGKYNTMVEMDENVVAEWANVEVQYQRRADLIPNLVNTVKGYASHEKEVLLGITEARAKVGSIQIDPSNITPSQLKQFQEAQGGLSSAISRLLMVSERYPELKANENFLQLTAQLEGTENRIAVARKRYNDVAVEYNKYIRKFPASMFAGMYGFEKKEMFEAEQGAEKAPEVSFE